jgi:hypothetical protein
VVAGGNHRHGDIVANPKCNRALDRSGGPGLCLGAREHERDQRVGELLPKLCDTRRQIGECRRAGELFENRRDRVRRRRPIREPYAGENPQREHRHEGGQQELPGSRESRGR